MTDKEKVFRLFDSSDTTNHYLAWQLCKGLGISIDEVIDYKINTRRGWELDYVYQTVFFNMRLGYLLLWPEPAFIANRNDMPYNHNNNLEPHQSYLMIEYIKKNLPEL
jgi:3-methyladenine DNA glycosylase AlkD